jgi:two-component system phosphate regulon response regulator PhoB
VYAGDVSGPATRVLLIDDEPDLRALVRFNLTAAGFEVEAVDTGAAGLAALEARRPAVVVLDLMLPDLPGVEICRRIRAREAHAGVGILMLTARGDEYDRMLGFEVGADDYVVKPFSVRELVYRVRALARRALPSEGAATSGELLRWRTLQMDPVRHRVHADGREISLRPLEFRVLKLLLERRDEVLTRSELLEHAWGITADISTRTVDTHMRRLREALGPHGDLVETVRGFGYRLRKE